MPNFNAAFKAEVSRLARKEVRELVGATKKATTQHRRDIAALKREIASLTKHVAALERGQKRSIGSVAEAPSPGARFSAKRLRAHREKLGLSAADYGLLLGVTGQTIYNWESERGTPRAAKVAEWAAMRGIGVREALKRLEALYE
jgi:DNA-binding transcriptional regulator YiaG